MRIQKSVCWLFCFMFLSFLCGLSVLGQSTDTYEDTRNLLVEFGKEKRGPERLARLFLIGDERIDDLIKALDEKDTNIQIKSQRIIRYLANPKGMSFLYENYLPEKLASTGHNFSLPPIVSPLRDFDYDFINKTLLKNDLDNTNPFVVKNYAYALRLDKSKKALSLLEKWLAFSRENNYDGRFLESLLKKNNLEAISGSFNLEKEIIKSDFLIDTVGTEILKSKLIGYSFNKDKALLEIKAGEFFTRRYHIVLKNRNDKWEFLSITFLSFH